MKNNNYYILTPDELKKAKEVWTGLEKRRATTCLTTQWDWVETWINTYKDLVEYSFFVALKKNEPVGITLVVKEINRQFSQFIKTYHIGTNGEPLKDQARMVENRLVTLEGEKEFFLSSLLTYLQKTLKSEDIIFNDFNAEEAQFITNFLKKNHYKFSVLKELCPQFNLEQARKENKDPLLYFSKTVNYTYRRTLKAFGEDDLSLEVAENTEQALAFLDDLITFYTDKWVKRKGRRGMFDSPFYTSFQKELIQKLGNKDDIIMSRLVSKKYGVLACTYLLVDNGVAYGYIVGQKDINEIASETINDHKVKLGIMLHILNTRYFLRKGLYAYNFAPGPFAYKLALSNEMTETVHISVKSGFKPYLRDGITQLYLYLDSHKKLSKYLWQIRKMLKF